MTDFSIMRTLGTAFEFMVIFFWQITGLLIQASLLAIAFDMALRHLFGLEAASWLATIFFAPVSVAIHRAIVLGQTLNAKHYLLKLLQGRVWRFIGWGLLAGFIIGVFALLGVGLAFQITKVFGDAQTVLVLLAPLLFVLAALAYLFRYAFIFPAIATDNFQSLNDVKKLMTGLTLKVFSVMLMIALVGAILATMLKSTDSMIYWLILLVSLFYLAALAPAALSVAYNEASEIHGEPNE